MTMTYHDTTILDIAPLFSSGGTASLDRQIAEVLETEASFVATGFPGCEGHDKRVSDVLRFFDMPLKAKMTCTVQQHHAAHSNIYRGCLLSLFRDSRAIGVVAMAAEAA
ncbi:MAG: hypothetical protein GDA49_11725 [Rhodospirillales bacterium]|nr:hypothetical protein [Rhodospirillales bacterium]